MSPKAKKDEFEPNPVVKALLHILASQTTLNFNSDEIATLLGLNGPKNLPRKLNQTVELYGFRYEYGKFIEILPTNANGLAATGRDDEGPVIIPATPVRFKAINAEDDTTDKSTTKAKKKAATPGPKKGSTSAKKRKAEEGAEHAAEKTPTKKHVMTRKEEGEAEGESCGSGSEAGVMTMTTLGHVDQKGGDVGGSFAKLEAKLEDYEA